MSCKTSSWHFGESFEKFEKFWQNVKIYTINESWQCPNCIVSLNLAQKNWQNSYKVILKMYCEPNWKDPENRPIAQFYSRDDLNAIVTGLQLL